MNETSKLGYVLQAVNIFGSALRTGLVLVVARPSNGPKHTPTSCRDSNPSGVDMGTDMLTRTYENKQAPAGRTGNRTNDKQSADTGTGRRVPTDTHVGAP